ncbi:ABC transporter permease/substrate-binding protein [Bacilliculturomica massiliensis]|uniref:ABC transporter permease/substrate-binding protein n=1 Tax=Bacilliculturomica massiliensis TaxID=1917867 RepID=UPI0010321227|nr:glycine betaine ABC transporter substrate-binding protein [Bacilliculturomica massiliensis]
MLSNMLRLLAEKKGFFLGLLWEHLSISVISILIALIIGLLAGVLISEYQKSSRLVLGFINFVYTIPSISLLGFLIPFSGIGDATAVIALTIYALLPMVRNTHTGITNIDENILEAARGLGSTRLQMLFKIKLPLAMPVIMSGLRSMATMTIALAGIASFIGAGGLGVAIYRGITTNNAAMTMAGSLLIAALAIAVDLLLGTIETIVHHRSKANRKRTAVTAAAALLLCAAVAVSSIFSGSGDQTLRIATKPMTEQYILGEMLRELVEQDTDLKVELTQGVGGGTSNIQTGMEKGEFDLYPEYTGTGWNMVLKKDSLYSEDLFDEMKKEYEDTLHLTWDGMYGFNNTFGLAVRRDAAQQYDLKTYSDLARVSDQLTFGAEYDFYQREDGYDGLCETYGFRFKKTSDMDIGLKYQAIQQGKIDVMTIFTTDGQLAASDIVVLKDDKQFYPSYLCGNVVRMAVLEQHPGLKDVLGSLNGILSDETMAELNYAVETEGQEPKTVAHDFLKDAGLVK